MRPPNRKSQEPESDAERAAMLVKEIFKAEGQGLDYLFQVLPAFLEALIQDDLYKSFKTLDGGTYSSFYALATALPPDGLGFVEGKRQFSYQQIVELCASGRPDVARMLREQIPAGAAKPGPKVGSKNKVGINNNIINSPVQGTSPTYATQRLKRDHPELHKQVVAGEISANKAAIQAGFRHRTFTAHPDDPDQVIRMLVKHMSPEALAAVRAGI